MEGCTDLAIDERFVIHVLDNRLPAVQCSQVLTPLPEAFRTTLETYLLSLLKPRFRRKHYGRFQPESPVLQEYQGFLTSWEQHGQVEAEAFLDASQRLAALLFRAMQQAGQNGAQPRPGTITPGDLLMGLFYDQTSETSSLPHLFLVKVDLETAVQRQIEPRGDGGIRTLLRRQEGLIPKLSTAHVQKSALIRWADEPSTYDVIMTDPQGGKQGIAKFFAEDFLHTEPFRTPDEQAELLFRRAHTWVADHEEALSPQERGEVMETVRMLLEESGAKAEPVTPRHLIEALPLPEPRDVPAVQELRQSFEQTLTAPQVEEDRIPADRELLIQSVPPAVAKTRVTYQLDHGVQLSGDPDAIAQLFVTPPHRVGEDTEFTIRTSTFRPVL